MLANLYPEVTAEECNVPQFIKDNYTPFLGEADFLVGPTERTTTMWNKCLELLKEELKKGILDCDVDVASTVTSHKAGFILDNHDDEVIKGVQADAPLKRTLKPLGGARIVYKALKSYGYDMDPKIWNIYTEHTTTHNDAVFAMYTDEMRAARHVGIVTGLPDGYGRGRIIGDYRRIALYGMNQLVEWKEADLKLLDVDEFTNEVMQRRSELTAQIKALKEIVKMGAIYGDDLSRPAQNAREAVQWTYYGYLAGIKQQDGAAMSFGRVDAFFDIFIEKDLEAGKITESEAQELIDQLIIKLRLVRHLRTPEYNDLFSGDPTWVTCVIGGMVEGGETLVNKTSYRMLHTLYNLGPAPEPNLTVLWSEHLPVAFKKFACKVSVDTSSIQYENDDLMRPMYGDDYAIACCVSAMRVGKDMQYFGARVNLSKLLLYTLNDGVDEIHGVQVSPKFGGHVGEGVLDFDVIMPRYKLYMNWLAKLYVKTMNCIHYSHDLHCYESAQLGLHDSNVHRYMAFGIAGLSCAADSLSAIKYAKVTPVRDERGLITDFQTEGEFPCYGNNDDRVDSIANQLVTYFMSQLRLHPAHRGAEHTLSILTITSNVVYGRKTGTTPDGRKRGEPLAPGCNPMHGRDNTGAVNCLASVAKVPYRDAQDGISLTFSIIPSVLGKESDERAMNLAGLLDGYFQKTGHHINVNCLTRETLLDAQQHPENYPQLTVRVSGYAILFTKLTKDQQNEVISRTFHGKI